MRSNRGFVAFALTLSLAGCGSSANKLVGTWHSSMGGANTTYHFRANNTFTMETEFAGAMGTANGNYRMDGDRLILEPTSSNATGPEEYAGPMRTTLTQSARIQLRWDTPASFSLLMGNEAPLMVSKVAPEP